MIDMKHSVPRSLLYFPLMLVMLLPACSEMDGQISALKDRIAATRDTNQAAYQELQQMNQKLSLANRQINSESSKRTEFEAKAKKSAASEKTLIKYREDVAASLTEFTASVAAYRQKYLAP